MGKNKKYLIKSVNLGEVGHPSRILAEMYIKKFGANEFSALIRKLMMIFLSGRTDFKNWEKEALIFERKELQKKIPEISDQLCKNAEKLEKLGVDINDF